MARRVHQVKHIGLAVLGGVIEAHRLGFNCDTALFFDIHIIQNLFGHFPVGQPAGKMDQTVRQSGLAMINMGDNGKIPNIRLVERHGGYLLYFTPCARGFAKRQQACYDKLMIEKVISSVVLVLFMCAMPALAQSAPDENDQEPSGEYLEYEGGVYAEVFGLSRSASLSSGPDHDFTPPENREDWLTIAEKIKNNEIDDAVYYAMLRGEKPEDIFTPDLMEIYQKNYEEWLLSKWEPSIENERTRLQGFEETARLQKRAEALLAQRSENQDAEIWGRPKTLNPYPNPMPCRPQNN